MEDEYSESESQCKLVTLVCKNLLDSSHICAIIIQDVASVSALLDKLKASQAWADLEAQSTCANVSSSESQATNASRTNVGEENSAVHEPPSVAVLLSQLSASSLPMQPPHSPVTSSEVPTEHHSEMAKNDIRSLTFRQSLPYITDLADKSPFREALSKVSRTSTSCFLKYSVDTYVELRREQNELEKQLWEEREELHQRHQDKVKTAVTK